MKKKMLSLYLKEGFDGLYYSRSMFIKLEACAYFLSLVIAGEPETKDKWFEKCLLKYPKLTMLFINMTLESIRNINSSFYKLFRPCNFLCSYLLLVSAMFVFPETAIVCLALTMFVIILVLYILCLKINLTTMFINIHSAFEEYKLNKRNDSEAIGNKIKQDFVSLEKEKINSQVNVKNNSTIRKRL